MAERKLTTKTPDVNFTVTIPDDIPEIFVDGMSRVAFGLPFTKILFHSVHAFDEGTDAKTEDRQGVLVLTIQTATLVEMCNAVLKTALASETQFEEGHQFLAKNLKAHLEAARVLSKK